ncbi:hypothetical protein IPC11_27730 [Pseudomonas aeruginosa]|nr:hypothetical protein IPC11_27730 [Pseudomonas aeruginosa]
MPNWISRCALMALRRGDQGGVGMVASEVDRKSQLYVRPGHNASRPGELGVWGATEQKVHLSPAPARKPLWRLVSSGKPSFCRTIASPFVIGV